MRPAPGTIPDKMPSIQAAMHDIVMLMDMSRERLMGYSISELVNQYSDGSPKWLVGSTVWLPAVFGEIDKETDLDIVFQDKDAMHRFADGVYDALTSIYKGDGGYHLTTNGNNGRRINHPDGTHIIDMWHMDEDETIQEMLLTFPHNYQRCAYYMTWNGSSPAYLTRIVKERKRMGRIEAQRAAGGYGRREAVQLVTPAPAPAPTTIFLDLAQRWDGGYGR